jgi:hypothetical protein
MNAKQLEDIKKQAEIVRDVNKPRQVVLPDKLKHALRLLSDKKRALLNLPFPVYPGQIKSTPPPESIQARAWQDRYVKRGYPYQNLIKQLGSGSSEKELAGQQSIQNQLLNDMLKSQQSFGQKYIDQYGINANRLNYELSRLRGISSEKLAPLAQDAANQDFDRRGQFAQLMKALQEQKLGRRQSRVDELQKLAHVKKYHEEKGFEAQKNEYEEQAKHPWKQIALFEEEMKPIMGITYQSPPEIQEYAGAIADTAKNAVNQPYAAYKGQRVAPLPEDLTKAQSFAGKLTGSGISLKPIKNEILAVENNGNKLADFIHPYIQNQSADLEKQMEKRLPRELEKISVKYARLGQHGSIQHTNAEKNMIQDMLKSVAQGQHSLVGEGYQRALSDIQGQQARRMQNLALTGEAKEQKFRQNLDALRAYRRRGTKDFLKEQKGFNAAYNDYKRQDEAKWPHRRREMILSPASMPIIERKAR